MIWSRHLIQPGFISHFSPFCVSSFYHPLAISPLWTSFSPPVFVRLFITASIPFCAATSFLLSSVFFEATASLPLSYNLVAALSSLCVPPQFSSAYTHPIPTCNSLPQLISITVSSLRLCHSLCSVCTIMFPVASFPFSMSSGQIGFCRRHCYIYAIKPIF